MSVRNALLSVSDPTGLVPLAKILARQGVKLYATGGTARRLRAAHLAVSDISSLTRFPEILRGRVKTLHPAVFAGLLARVTDSATLRKYKFPRMDILVCNFYPLPASRNLAPDKLSDHIDIGGVALVRAAAKNSSCVLPLVSPDQYGAFAQRLLSGRLHEPDYRRRLSAAAWGLVAQYDLKIFGASLRALNGQSPEWFIQACEEKLPLRYGENPHQRASFFLPLGIDKPPFEILQGKPLSYCNLLDVQAAIQLWVDAPRRPFCSILKHTNPCGAAVGVSTADAFRRAFNGDPQSAFGGILLFNRSVDGAAAREMADRFFEVVVAPGFDARARELLACKKSLRLLRVRVSEASKVGRGVQIRSALGGFLFQNADRSVLAHSRWKRVAGKRPSKSVLADLDLAQRLVKHTKSNAVVLVRRGQSVGIGSGQQSRIDAARIAIDKARRYGHSLSGSVCASDGFFPFPDSVELLSKSGVTAILEPGGSVRDPDVIAAARNRRVTLFLTGRRHFRH